MKLTSTTSDIYFTPLDYIIYGKCGSDQEKERHIEELAVIENMLDSADDQIRKCAFEMLKLLLSSGLRV